MAWVTPSNKVTGNLITAAIWNQDVVANPTQNRNDILALQADASALYSRPIPFVINNRFQVWQRGTSFTHTGAKAYFADRWAGRRGANAAGMTISRQATTVSQNIYKLRMQRDSGNSDVNSLILVTSLPTETVQGLRGKNMTLVVEALAGANFSAASNALNYRVSYDTSPNLSPDLNVGTNIVNSSWSITTSLVTYTANFTVPSNAQSLVIQLLYNPVGTAGAADYVELFNVDIAPQATNTAGIMPLSYELELLRCQRFFVRWTPAHGTSAPDYIGVGIMQLDTAARIVVNTPVAMRESATIVASGGFRVYGGVIVAGPGVANSGNLDETAITVIYQMSSVVNLYISTGTLSGTRGGVALMGLDTTNGYFQLSAEL